MMWGVLATHDDTPVFSVEILVRFKLVCFRNVRYLKLACILAYFGNGECVVVSPFDEIHTPCSILC